jgi:hypothetical protein
MILHRLKKRQTAKIKIDSLMFFAKNRPKIIFSVVKQKVIFPHIAVVQEDIDVLVLSMTLSPNAGKLYFFKTAKK